MHEPPQIMNNRVLITEEEYNEYRKLKKYRCRVFDCFEEIKMLIKRLLMLEELLSFSERETYSKEDIKNNMDLTIDELYNSSEKYEAILENIDFPYE